MSYPSEGAYKGIVGVIPRSVLILKEQAPVSVSDAKAPWVAACKAMHAIDYLLWKEERSEALSVQSLPDGKNHEEITPLGVDGWPQGDGTCVPFLHCVSIGLVLLCVLDKLKAAVIAVVDG